MKNKKCVAEGGYVDGTDYRYDPEIDDHRDVEIIVWDPNYGACEYEDISLHAMKCRNCGHISYYSGYGKSLGEPSERTQREWKEKHG